MGTVEQGTWGEEPREIQFIKGRVLCRLDPVDGNPRESIPIEEFDGWLEEFSLTRSRNTLPPGWFLYENLERDALEDGQTLSMIDAINTSDARVDGLDYTAYPDGLMAYHTLPPTDSRYPRQWGLRAVGVDKAWRCTTGDQGVWLAIVDSGMPVIPDPDPNNPQFVHDDLDDASRFQFGLAFADGASQFEQFSNYSVPADQLPEDKEGHGTHVLGIMAAEAGNILDTDAGGTVGVNWRSRVYVTAMEPMIGVGGTALGSGASQLAMAITEIASWMSIVGERRVVINISLGGEDFTRDVVRKAIAAAVGEGAIIVASTGNNFGPGDVDCVGDVCAPASFAKTFPHGVISVGAYAEPPAGTRPVVAPWSNPSNGIVDPGPVTVVAPGSGIHSTTFLGQNAGWGDMKGTSQAAPLVAGIVSLYWGLNQNLTNGQVIQAVKDTAVPLDDSATPHRRWGHGRIDAEALVCGEKPEPTFVGDAAVGEGIDPDPVEKIIWRHKVETCAFAQSEDTLRAIAEDDGCATATTAQLAASLRLRGWLGDADWDGTGRTSGGI